MLDASAAKSVILQQVGINVSVFDIMKNRV